MRRIAAVALSAVTLTGGLALAAPAEAATNSAGVSASVTEQGTLSGKALLAQAKSQGTVYSTKDAAVVARAATCRWIQRTQGWKTVSHPHWLFYVRNRLSWCYDGAHVTWFKMTYGAYTYNKYVYKWRGWANQSLTHGPTYLSATAYARGRFVYHSRTYKPYVMIQGFYNGASKQWWG